MSITTGAPVTAPELYAKAIGRKCEGALRCHWCWSPCTDRDLNDDPPPVPFTRSRSGARNPGGLFVCTGCWEFRRFSVTTKSIGGVRKDRQKPSEQSWLITDQARVIYTGEESALYDFLLEPKFPFCLMLNRGTDVYLHLAEVNTHGDDKTMLKISIDNIIHRYSVYELFEGLANGTDGREPGVRALVELLGPYGGSKRQAPEKRTSARVPVKK